MLEGEACVARGLGFAGVKGYVGGFGKHALQPWGESSLKRIVHEAVHESLRLESALAHLKVKHKIALLHYAPVEETVRGEPLEIYPFLGSSRLEEPLNRYAVSAVFHGHAHYGRPEGKTSTGVPVYNVSLPLLERVSPGNPGFRLTSFHVQKEAVR
jgi:Icc-related predicted phosphoesterase